MNQAHTVIGIRGRVIPSVRRSIVVVTKLNELCSAANEKMEALMSHKLIPEFNGRKNEPVIPSKEANAIQKENRLSDGKAISRAPICSGKR
jgi:hypothetical protein